MALSFVAIAIGNISGAVCGFGYAFILWCILAVDEYRKSKKNDFKE